MRAVPFAAIVVLPAVVLASCGDPSTTAAVTPTAAAVVPVDDGEASGGATAPPLVQVVLADYHFEGLPTEVPAGTRFEVVNNAPTELHELVAFRLPDDDTRLVADLAALSEDELLEALGEPVMVLLAMPGGPQIVAVGDGTLTEPGRYALMCFIPEGVDGEEYLRAAVRTDHGPPRLPGGPPHFMYGMFAELLVTG